MYLTRKLLLLLTLVVFLTLPLAAVNAQDIMDPATFGLQEGKPMTAPTLTS